MTLLNPMDDDQLDAVIEGLERIKELEAEVARLRLTDAERWAIKSAIQCCEDITYGGAADQGAADVLKALLERTK